MSRPYAIMLSASMIACGYLSSCARQKQTQPMLCEGQMDSTTGVCRVEATAQKDTSTVVELPPSQQPSEKQLQQMEQTLEKLPPELKRWLRSTGSSENKTRVDSTDRKKNVTRTIRRKTRRDRIPPPSDSGSGGNDPPVDRTTPNTNMDECEYFYQTAQALKDSGEEPYKDWTRVGCESWFQKAFKKTWDYLLEWADPTGGLLAGLVKKFIELERADCPCKDLK